MCVTVVRKPFNSSLQVLTSNNSRKDSQLTDPNLSLSLWQPPWRNQFASVWGPDHSFLPWPPLVKTPSSQCWQFGSHTVTSIACLTSLSSDCPSQFPVSPDLSSIWHVYLPEVIRKDSALSLLPRRPCVCTVDLLPSTPPPTSWTVC